MRTCGLLVLLLSTAAGAHGLSFNTPDRLTTVGLLTAVSFPGRTRYHLGLEATHNKALKAASGSDTGFYPGAFFQAEVIDLQRMRIAAGPQLTFAFLGLELGAAYEGPSPTEQGTANLQASLYVSFAVTSLALRITVPVAAVSPGGGGPLPPGHAALVLTFKLPNDKLNESGDWTFEDEAVGESDLELETPLSMPAAEGQGGSPEGDAEKRVPTSPNTPADEPPERGEAVQPAPTGESPP